MRLSPIIAVIPIVLVGCGGGDDPGSPMTVTTTVSTAQVTISKAEFVSRADAISGAYQARSQRLQRQGNRTQGFGGLEEVARGSERILRAASAKLAALPMPTDAAGANEFIATLNQVEGTYREVALAAEQHDRAALRRDAQTLKELAARAQGVAVTYGFEQCGKG